MPPRTAQRRGQSAAPPETPTPDPAPRGRRGPRNLAPVPDAQDTPQPAAEEKPEPPKAYVVPGTWTFDRYQGEITKHNPDGSTERIEVNSRFGHITREAALAAAKTAARQTGLEVRES